MSKTRILFLKNFVKELIINSKKETVLPPQDEIIIPQKLPITREQERKISVEIKNYMPSQFVPQNSFTPSQPQIQTLPTRPIQPQPHKNPVRRMMSVPNISMPPQQRVNPDMQLKPENLPSNFSIGRLDSLISDPRVSLIECPGPGKDILAQIYGRKNSTKIVLNQDEIQKVIDIFSKSAKIPVLSGLFKAAVGNLIITAVVSELVGSRFIISKITPTFVYTN